MHWGIFFARRASRRHGGAQPDTDAWRRRGGGSRVERFRRRDNEGARQAMSGLRPFFLCFLRARVRHFSACSLPTECRNGTSRSPRHRRSTFPFSRVCNEGEKRTNKARKEQGAEGGCIHRRRHACYTNNGDDVCIAYRAMVEKRKRKKKEKRKRRVENARATSWDRQIGTREALCKLDEQREKEIRETVRGRGRQEENAICF